mmetsp:Transcript_12931/g.24626  ORF Transcript_12931/g.24626 Transcript_12931/m.24626 type:complete len:235 (+) Transcript_12931:355-1059(+)
MSNWAPSSEQIMVTCQMMTVVLLAPASMRTPLMAMGLQESAVTPSCTLTVHARRQLAQGSKYPHTWTPACSLDKPSGPLHPSAMTRGPSSSGIHARLCGSAFPSTAKQLCSSHSVASSTLRHSYVRTSPSASTAATRSPLWDGAKATCSTGDSHSLKAARSTHPAAGLSASAIFPGCSSSQINTLPPEAPADLHPAASTDPNSGCAQSTVQHSGMDSSCRVAARSQRFCTFLYT